MLNRISRGCLPSAGWVGMDITSNPLRVRRCEDSAPPTPEEILKDKGHFLLYFATPVLLRNGWIPQNTWPFETLVQQQNQSDNSQEKSAFLSERLSETRNYRRISDRHFGKTEGIPSYGRYPSTNLSTDSRRRRILLSSWFMGRE